MGSSVALRGLSAQKGFEGGLPITSTWEETLAAAAAGLWAGSRCHLELPLTHEQGPVAWR